ncbi:hypothetical protein IPM19_00570 [bacterium]|nr:MAG: hypothetical protein IPM19_00570 [bacterium]
MITKLRLILMVLTFIVGLLAAYCGSDDDNSKNSDLHKKMAFAVHAENKAEYAGWKQLRAVNATVTHFKMAVLDANGEIIEAYTYVLTESEQSSGLTVYATVSNSDIQNIFEIDDDDLDGKVDDSSGVLVNFPGPQAEESYNKRIVPNADGMADVQAAYDTALALLPQ